MKELRQQTNEVVTRETMTDMLSNFNLLPTTSSTNPGHVLVVFRFDGSLYTE